MNAPLLQSIDLKMKLLFSAVLLLYIAFPVALNSTSELAQNSRYLLQIDSVEVLPNDIDHSELTHQEADWRAVDLPFHWRGQFGNTRAVWYRITLSQDELLNNLTPDTEPSDLLGIYLWRINQTADIWFNGTALGSGGRTDGPMARYWNTPLYFSLPATLVSAQNQIYIKHYAEHGWGSMEPLIFGPDVALRPAFERRSFIQHDIALGLFVFVLVTGGLSLMVWFYRRQESEYLWFALASAGLSFYCLNQFIRYLPVEPQLWRWLLNLSIDFWAICTFIFILRSLHLERAAAERNAKLYFLLAIPLYFYASYQQIFAINIYYHAGSIVAGIYIFSVCLQAVRRTGDILPAFYCFTLILVLIAGIHDILMQAALNIGWTNELVPEFQNHFNFIHFAAPLIFLLIAGNLMKRFVLSMNAADEMNEQLELRVASARQELDENYKAIEAVMMKQSAQEERERIYRDLHDDVGSKLLSLYYRLDREADSLLAKSALEDLRDIVSHKALEGCSLSDAMQQWRAEVEERVNDAGITLHWHSECQNNSIQLTELQHTQLRRMLREVLSNAILHSKSLTQIKISVTLDASQLTFAIDNDGVENPVADWQPGRGISNLRVRARDLSGKLALQDLKTGWVRITWTVPLEPATESAIKEYD